MSGQKKRRGDAGVTLMELVIAVTLLSLLSVGLMMALRIGLTAYGKTQARLMDNRRVVGAQRILEEQLEGMMPVVTNCAGKAGFFQGDRQSMRFVSTFSLQQAWRGRPQLLEVFVINGDDGGVRLVVNEIPYTGPAGMAQFCVETGKLFTMPVAGPRSFVLADHLAYCRLSYLAVFSDPQRPPEWVSPWPHPTWPQGVRVEMAPLELDASKLQPITVTAPIHLHRYPELPYDDLSY
jgi:hypothetical protein